VLDLEQKANSCVYLWALENPLASPWMIDVISRHEDQEMPESFRRYLGRASLHGVVFLYFGRCE
jgi:hypothetical protein